MHLRSGGGRPLSDAAHNLLQVAKLAGVTTQRDASLSDIADQMDSELQEFASAAADELTDAGFLTQTTTGFYLFTKSGALTSYRLLNPSADFEDRQPTTRLRRGELHREMAMHANEAGGGYGPGRYEPCSFCHHHCTRAARRGGTVLCEHCYNDGARL